MMIGWLLSRRLGELLGLGAFAFLAVDAPDDAIGVLELVDGVLKLVIEHGAVGDHDDRVEHLLALLVVQRGELVRGPGDGVGLAGAGAVLERGTCARGLPRGWPATSRLTRSHWWIAGEDQGFLGLAFARPSPPSRLDLQVDEAAEDLEQVVAGEAPRSTGSRWRSRPGPGQVVARAAVLVPRLKGRKNVSSPASRVVMHDLVLS